MFNGIKRIKHSISGAVKGQLEKEHDAKLILWYYRINISKWVSRGGGNRLGVLDS